ncbi:PREDICTED: bidirectional sugar transporter N3-like [Erythranthe guttata]|uniref:bidirectional sugar transporter N3-like n=1 Tax=Erythranthe guttata TaxID=4155 RepID=UPI00064DCB45|nr:PREDICTED: bidirectional sugar transporter N3-like [Erythranthe guttata]|eukprot:XP_012832648.1 PREDICTED: bidirectional sugar transporter N3-like [Erythranthe guttata]
MVAHLVAVFGYLGVVISVFVYLAPVLTFIKIYGEKSTVGYSVMPYTVALMSSGIWLYYGAIEKDGHLLIGVNAFGCVVERVYIIMYIVYSPPHRQVRAIRSRSMAFMPITLTCVLNVNTIIWGVYGFLRGDAVIWVPNTIGLVLGVVQVIVYLQGFRFLTSKIERNKKLVEKGKVLESLQRKPKVRRRKGTKKKEGIENSNGSSYLFKYGDSTKLL